MPKRKADDALQSSLEQQPAKSSGTGPFAVYFPSRFDPNGDIACEWQAYSHSQRRNQLLLVAKTVRYQW
jgi:DNA-directed RNA polymerase I subunit RPA49